MVEVSFGSALEDQLSDLVSSYPFSVGVAHPDAEMEHVGCVIECLQFITF